MNPEVLNSWKEIAAYLGRGVRTVQRWEHELHLPVRRPRGKERSAVIALKSDIDRWLQKVPQGVLPADSHRDAHSELRKNTELLMAHTAQLVKQSRILYARMEQSLALTSALQRKKSLAAAKFRITIEPTAASASGPRGIGRAAS